LQERAQRESKPSLCKRLATLKRWCAEGNWVIDAIAWDAEQAMRRSEMLHEQERQQAQEDVRTLAGCIRGAIAVSALLLNSYVDAQTGELRREGDLRHVAALLKTCLQSLSIIHPGHGVQEPPRYQVQRLLADGSPEQRRQALQAMRQLDNVLSDFKSGGR
jgi:hypothetical protein